VLLLIKFYVIILLQFIWGCFNAKNTPLVTALPGVQREKSVHFGFFGETFQYLLIVIASPEGFLISPLEIKPVVLEKSGGGGSSPPHLP